MRRSTRQWLGTVVSAVLVTGLMVVAPTSASAATDPVVFDDMELGDPLNNGWFAFNGAVGGGGIAENGADLPPLDGGELSLETGWGSGGNAGFYGGFGRTKLTDTTVTDHFNFWINPNAAQDYTLEINIQEDDNGDDLADPADDDEFQFNCVVSATGPCAVSGGGWQLVSLPMADFFRDSSAFTGGNGVLDPIPTSNGGNGQLVNVVVAVIGTGSDVNFRTDYWAFSDGPRVYAPSSIIDDFENGLPEGAADPNGEPLGFYTFQGAGSSIRIGTPATPPAPELPAVGTPNKVLRMDVDSTSFAGYIHAFENEALDKWVTQNWSTSEGFSFWMYGSGSGTQMFIDILDNRNPGSTTDDAERFTVPFTDDFTGWQLLEFPFADFVRKEIGNGAPNDGLGLVEMHGYALGALNTSGARAYYVDNVSVYGVAEPPALAVNFSKQNTFIEEGTTGDVGVKLNRAMGPDDPAEVSIDFATERSNAIRGEDFTPTSGTLTFANGGPNELSFPVETFDNTKFTGDKQVVIRLTNPVGAERGTLFQGSVLIDDNDDFDPKLLDDFEQGAYLWDTEGLVTLDSQSVEAGDADERPEQDQVENIGVIDAAAAPADGKKFFDRAERAVRKLEKAGNTQTEIDQIVAASAALATEAVEVAERNGGDAKRITRAQRRIAQAEKAAAAGRDSKAVQNYRKAWQEATKALDALVKEGEQVSAGALVRDFPLGQDWTGTESLDFWFKGAGTGETVTVNLKDNRAPDPGPKGWELAWSDEFDDARGTPPNPANWAYEIGDTTPDGKNGWGNEELQYYTDDPANAQTDGNGNLAITLDEADGSQECYYGPCEFESARLITQNKAEFAYGRIESRLQVPTGGEGLWPAFWSLGTDITHNPWPGAGEIDVMEYVSRIPDEIFGTIHGPGYAGGESFSDIYDFGERVDLGYHEFAVEWEPNLITWYVDGIKYHEAEPADVAPDPWVFEKPFFLLLNFAIGGNFGGAIDPENTYPQEYLVDYVRVYQGPNTAERFDATFTDASTDWQQVSIPLTEFVRSDDQPAGAPDDGLGLDEVWGYGLDIPYAPGGGYQVDLVRRTPVPPPTELTVTNLDDSGEGSLREALGRIADDGTITFDASLADGTLTLTSGQLAIDSSVTVDASAAAPVTISGDGVSRVLQVAAGAEVAMNDLVIRDGVAAPQGGGILNYGDLSLDLVVVTDNQENSTGTSFDRGGGGIYNGDGATLTLTDSTVSNNSTVEQPGGGIYGFFNSTINVTRSTLSGNVGGDVAGGLRSLGDSTIVNSTVSGNTSTAWHGGGIFHTDGQLTVTNSTFTGNNAPAGTASGILVATFGTPANATLTNNVLEGNGGAFACATEGGGAATITSGGSNVISDGSCNPNGTTDQADTDALLGPLADNGGPTQTQALGAGSPAIDAADAAASPATDQRGVARPQGAGPDAGSYEVEPG